MTKNIFKNNTKKKVSINSKYNTSQKFNKYKSLYDSNSDNSVVILDIERATVYEAKEFYNYINDLLDNGKNRIIIDMDKVYFLDSIFFGTLIKLLKKADKQLGYIKLIVDYNSKPELLSISNFEGIFDIYPNLFEAVNVTKAS